MHWLHRGPDGRRHRPVTLGALALAAAFAASAIAPGIAAARFGQPSATMSLSAPAQVTAGHDATAVATLVDGRGRPVSGTRVSFSLDVSFLGNAVTDGSGTAAFTVPGSRLTALGSHRLRASSGGFGGGASASATITVVAAASSNSRTSGGGSAPALRTGIAVQIPSGGEVGQDVNVVAILRDSYGRKPAGQRLQLLLDGAQIKSADTDSGGQVAFTIPGRKLNGARSYVVMVNFSGSHGYLPSSAQSTLTVLAAAVQIATVPAVAGLSFSLAGSTALTGPDGVADLPVPISGTYPVTANLNPDESGATPLRVSFISWADGVPTANRNLSIDGPARFVIGVRVAYPIDVEYVDMSGRPVDSSLVEQATLLASDGTEATLDPQHEPDGYWLTGSMAEQTYGPEGPRGLAPGAVHYSPTSVKVHGVEALAPGQEDWTPAANSTWTIKLRLYDLTVTTRDAFFGSPTSDRVVLTWADGSTSSASVGADGTASFGYLPEGKYLLTASTAAISASSYVALAGAQNATLRVVTMVDVMVVGAAVLVLLTLVAGVVILLWRRRAAGPGSSSGVAP
jgi:hypothetical protein